MYFFWLAVYTFEECIFGIYQNGGSEKIHQHLESFRTIERSLTKQRNKIKKYDLDVSKSKDLFVKICKQMLCPLWSTFLGSFDKIYSKLM